MENVLLTARKYIEVGSSEPEYIGDCVYSGNRNKTHAGELAIVMGTLGAGFFCQFWECFLVCFYNRRDQIIILLFA